MTQLDMLAVDDLVREIARALVDEPDAVEVETVSREENTVLRLRGGSAGCGQGDRQTGADGAVGADDPGCGEHEGSSPVYAGHTGRRGLTVRGAGRMVMAGSRERGGLPRMSLAGSARMADQVSVQAWVWLARIRKAQGRKGEVLAEILTDFPEKFAERKRLWLLFRAGTAGETAREVALDSHWLNKARPAGLCCTLPGWTRSMRRNYCAGWWWRFRRRSGWRWARTRSMWAT